jgi:hypothetical protein
MYNGVVDPLIDRGKTDASILTKTTVTDRWTPEVTGVTRRGSHMTMNAGDPYGCPDTTGFIRESELPILPFGSQRQHNFGRGKGQYFHRVSEGKKEMEIAVTL